MRGSNLVASVQSLLALGAVARGTVLAPETQIAQPAESAKEDAVAVALDRCK
jgi:hypothetical protein